MKAKFGKISIGCFIVTLILPIPLLLIIMKGLPADSWITPRVLLLDTLVVILMCLTFFSGFIFGIIGAVKKNLPKFIISLDLCFIRLFSFDCC